MINEFRQVLEGLKHGTTTTLVKQIESLVTRYATHEKVTSQNESERLIAELALALDAYVAFPDKVYTFDELEEMLSVVERPDSLRAVDLS